MRRPSLVTLTGNNLSDRSKRGITLHSTPPGKSSTTTAREFSFYQLVIYQMPRNIKSYRFHIVVARVGTIRNNCSLPACWGWGSEARVAIAECIQSRARNWFQPDTRLLFLVDRQPLSVSIVALFHHRHYHHKQLSIKNRLHTRQSYMEVDSNNKTAHN